MELKGLFLVEVSTYKSQFTRNEVGALWVVTNYLHQLRGVFVA
jgi:hypothetical protein